MGRWSWWWCFCKYGLHCLQCLTVPFGVSSSFFGRGFMLAFCFWWSSFVLCRPRFWSCGGFLTGVGATGRQLFQERTSGWMQVKSGSGNGMTWIELYCKAPNLNAWSLLSSHQALFFTPFESLFILRETDAWRTSYGEAFEYHGSAGRRASSKARHCIQEYKFLPSHQMC